MKASSLTRLCSASADDGFARQGALTFGLSAVTLGTNLATGVLVARALGADGRGQLTAILTATQLIGWTFAFGCCEATAYRESRYGRDDGVLGAWLVLSLPAGLAAVGIGEALLPVVMHAQTGATLQLARLFMLTAVFVPGGLLGIGVILGSGRFLLFNLVGLAQPALTAAAYLICWRVGVLSPAVALAVSGGVSLVVSGVVTARALRGRLGRPSWRRARPNVWYGVRTHATNLGAMMNTRLDLLIIPAFLSASSVGLYSVATNISWVIVSVSAALAAIVLPAAARDPDRGIQTVVRSLQATFAVATVLALAIAAVADVGLRVLYGQEFVAGDLALRLLLPGSVFYACSGVLWSGLYALDRPLSAAASQGAGVCITVVGLFLFLERGAIVAAAIVSSVSYLSVFLIGLALYRRAAGLAWREFLSLPQVVNHPVGEWLKPRVSRP